MQSIGGVSEELPVVAPAFVSAGQNPGFDDVGEQLFYEGITVTKLIAQ
jgi:hypothetical protein